MTRTSVDPALQKAIAGLEPFKGLPIELLTAIGNQARVVGVSAGQVLAKPSEMLHSLVFVLEGQLQTYWHLPDGKEVACANIQPGQALGWLSVIDSHPVQHSIRSFTAAKLLLIPLEVARKVVQQVPQVAQYVMRQMAETIRRLELQSRILGMPNAFQRVYVHLFHLAGASLSPGELKLPKQHEIASFVNTSRETVSRAVQLLIRQGVIQKQGRVVKVQKIDLLKEAAESGADVLSG